MKNSNLIFTALLLFLMVIKSSVAVSEQKHKELDWYWFFYERISDQYADTVVYRPFFMESRSGDKLFQASLMPVFFSRYKDQRNDKVKGLFGLYGSDNYRHTEKKEDYDSGLFPLYLYGKGADEKDRYFFIYPLGGNIKGKFAYDRISPYIFPGIALFFLYPPSGLFTWQTLFMGIAAMIPAYTEFQDKDYSGKALFWPIVKWGNGDKREDFRVLPFYAHNYKEGWYDTYSYFLLVNYRELYLRNDTRYTFFFFPFYGRKWSESGDISAYTILWPFFSWGYDKNTNDRSYNLPWPLVQIRDCDKPRVKSRIFFPFYGDYKYANNETFFVTPLYFRLKKETEVYQSTSHIACIIFWYFKRDYLKTHEYYGNSWRYLKFWPLFQAEWNDKDMFALNILSLLPFRDTAGYEKLYQPFWTLFEYRRKPDGEKHLGFLLRTYYQIWNDNFFKMKIPFIITYDSRDDRIRELSFFLSAFGYKMDTEGTYLKFLWIPLRIGDGDKNLISEEEKEYLSDEPESNYDKIVNFSGFNPGHGNLYDSSLDDKCFIKVNVF